MRIVQIATDKVQKKGSSNEAGKNLAAVELGRSEGLKGGRAPRSYPRRSAHKLQKSRKFEVKKT